jgi:hypothetical protein
MVRPMKSRAKTKSWRGFMAGLLADAKDCSRAALV